MAGSPFLKKRLWYVLSGEFGEISKSTIFTENLRATTSTSGLRSTEKMKFQIALKEARNSYFCVTPKDHRFMFVSLKRL